MKEGTQNQLAGESSPYLLQHAYNPVNWYPWKDEALKKAVDEDKLMVISIGYAACHWCHVMEHESFEDSTVASRMNEHYVSIKVDREERPDIDNVYMTACQVLTQWQGGGSCGWPLNIIALPDGRPVFAGTYYPRENWIKILEHFNELWASDRPAMEDMAGQLTAAIESMENVPPAEVPADFSLAFLDGLFPLWEEKLDFKEGGRLGAPKFPMPINYQFLLRYHYLNGNARALEAVEVSLEKMALGGIYDHLGGGFARYSVDAVWLVPHFEKMLYDNGQLVTLYSEAHRYRPEPLYEQVIRETLEFVAREMTSPAGGFYSSLDADSEGEEGKFYVWSEEEIDSLLKRAYTSSPLGISPESAVSFFKSYYNIKSRGNWEHGKNILHVDKSLEDDLEKWQKELGQDLSIESIRQLLGHGKAALLTARSERVRPGLDDKILTSWNALMLKGYIEAYKTLGESAYLETALRNAEFLEREMLQEDGRLLRNHKDGKSVINAFLDDYALLADAWIALYQITFDQKWLDYALKLTQYANDHFSDEGSSLYFYTSSLDPSLITRKKELNDNVIAASNSVMARNLLALSHYYARPDFHERASKMAAAMEPQVKAYPIYNANWAMMLTELAHTSFEVAITGKDLPERAAQFNRRFLPDVLLLGATKEAPADEGLSLLDNKFVKGETIIYVCRDKVCKLPVTDLEAALKQLNESW